MGLISAASDPSHFVALILAFVVAISIHEFAHAYVADRLGDPSPRNAGRVTVNPFRHLDPMGTVLLALVGFGWGRPVLVNPYNFNIGIRIGMAVVALAGPLSNLVLAAALAPLARESGQLEALLPGVGGQFLIEVVVNTIFINVLLAVFNMIPIPPLDGFSVLLGIVPRETAIQLERVRRYGPFVLLALLVAGPFLNFNILGLLLNGPIRILTGLLLG